MPSVTVRITKLVIVFLLLILGLSSTTLLKAQEKPTAIKYGQTIRSEITAQKNEINYTFEGEEGEVIIIRMEQNGNQGLKTPAFTVLNGDTSIIDSTKIFTLSETVGYTVFRLPEDATYTIVATRRGGKTGKDVGKFALSLHNAPFLTDGEAIDDQANDTNEKYYAIEPTRTFIITYGRRGGTFGPMISISAIRDKGSVEQVAEMSGKFLDAGAVSVTPEVGVTYLIQVSKAFLSNSKGNVEYGLQYQQRRNN